MGCRVRVRVQKQGAGMQGCRVKVRVQTGVQGEGPTSRSDLRQVSLVRRLTCHLHAKVA